MRQSKLKWLVGGLMVSAGGVLAVAGLPGRHGLACDGPVPLPIPMLPANVEPPISVPTPKPQDLPMSTPMTSPAPLSIPVVEASQPEAITVQPVKIEPAKSEPAKVEAATPPLEIPGLPAAPTPAPAPNAAPKPLELPELQLPSRSVPVIPASNATPASPAVPTAAPAAPAIPAPAPAPADNAPNIPGLPTPSPNPTPTPLPAGPAPAPTPATVESKPVPVQATVVADEVAAPSSTVERKLKVIVHLSDDRPRFEVRDGDEIYLKVVCDRVDVKSPSDKGERMSVLTASGRVTFITPGGEGTCEDLSLTPGTGQLTVMNKVHFKYNWGKLETTVSGEKMNFRLASAPSLPTSVSAIR